MDKPIIQTVNDSIDRLVEQFQEHGDRYWNEIDLHWSLFHYIKKDNRINEDYPTNCIRAEFPTIQDRYKKRSPGRGHFDLVVLDKNTLDSDKIRKLPSDTPWGEFLPKVPPIVAIEMKLWFSRSTKRYKDMINWDIEKLTDNKNKVGNPYFLNFVQLDFNKPHNLVFYEELQEYLNSKKAKYSNLKLSCVACNKGGVEIPQDIRIS